MVDLIEAGVADRRSTVRYAFDRSVRRFDRGRVLLGGSPLRLFRLTDAGSEAAESIAALGTAPGGSQRLVDRLIDAGALHPVPVNSEFGIDDVTVVIPVFSRSPAHVAVPHGPAACIVVDDASEVPVTVGEGVQLIRRHTNGGPAAARNTGLDAVTTPLVAFVDSDVIAAPEWLSPLLAHFADPRVAAVAPRVTSQPGTSVLERYERSRSPLDLGPERGRVAPGTRIGYTPAALLVARVDHIRAVGGFDTSMRVGEDVDLEWRLVGAGHRIRYDPAVEVQHVPRRSVGAMLRQRFGYGRSAALLGRRHGSAVAPVRMNAWSLAAWGAVVARRPLLGATIAIGSAMAYPRRLTGVPAGEAVLVALRGHVGGARQLAEAGRRAWWPAIALSTLGPRWLRRAALHAVALAVLELCARWRRTDRTVALPAWCWCTLAIADDIAYGAGVWAGVAQTRCVAPLVPEYRSRR